MKPPRRLTGRAKASKLLAAPIVVTAVVGTAVVGSACVGRTYVNPGPPTGEKVTASASASASASTAPTTTAAPTATTEPTSAPVASTEPLPDPPKEGDGKVHKQPDGTCLYIFPEPSTPNCPPGAYCNPGPPREPIKVKCPDEKAR
ncbi:MAG: hypothetical protein HOW73_22915 [Polyangiaceae bacterium]|nr:hypothetical protein [Polyangiaceae bacterium]